MALVGGLAVVLAPACSLGEGTGSVTGVLDVPLCWSGCFDLKPDFFAAVPSTSDALQLRIQSGGDYETFSDGLAILIDDAGEIRGDPRADGTPRPSLLGQTLYVTLPPEVTPPGVPVKPVASPAVVHVALYPDGTCSRPAGGEPPLPCGAPAGAPASVLGDAGSAAEAGTASAGAEA